ncbi:cytoplasmic dynein 2 intermediate chain 1-like isoform X1 [Biomphalaria glabrata]|uniref:Cytoplasmic dynein 2 intermediate chain 1-like isoform X1 n=1 Tax=Biomphalaria glabrata TaxID=6526 RepID=A0A9W2YAZ8_BIOGL|nr:cytoplasmic dynein 2 intermediate chain 1-like isoform X1 [Biomphalaria glabrata]
MPSENRRPKDDTWTSAELNRALKGSKDDSHRTKKSREDGERRHHRDERKGSDHVKDEGKRSIRQDEDERKSKKHRERGDSDDKVELTEAAAIPEDRDRLRQERRSKREGGGTEEKHPRVKESKPNNKTADKDEDRKKHHRDRDEDRKRHERDRDEERESRKRLAEEEESVKHKKDRDRERRQYEKEKERARQEEEEKSHRRHKVDDGNDGKKRRHKEEASSRHQEGSERQHRPKDLEEDEDERERRRQERRERHEREKAKEKSKDKEREIHKDRRRETEREKSTERKKERAKEKDKERDRTYDIEKDRKHDREGGTQRKSGSKGTDDQKPSRKDKPEDQDSEKRRSKHHEVEEKQSQPSEEEKDDYNYEEDFEDYDDDFEDDTQDDDDDDEEDESPHQRTGGEMEEVLRALDEENHRVASSTSRRSDLSESNDRSDDYTKDELPSRSSKPRAFINFVSAKQKVINRTGKAWKRYEDLSKLIELDVSKYEMFDLPPVKEYDLYIRSFGRSDTRQAYVQTRDDDIDRDIQTEDVETLVKWTQHPPDNEIAVGGEGINVQTGSDRVAVNGTTDPEKLNTFLNKVGQFLFTILDEESKSSSDEEKMKENKSKISFSEKVFQLGASFLKGHSVVALSFCQSEPNFLLSIHGPHYDFDQVNMDKTGETSSVSTQQSSTQSMSFICVWNISQPTYPYRICGSDMKITTACFSPTRAALVFAGMSDGSVALWDLRETGSHHRNLTIEDQEHLVRFPTYITARVLEYENHTSPVVKIVPVDSHLIGSQKGEIITASKSGLSFQLASIDENAVLNLWVVAEVSVPDAAGSESDLGLAPAGKIKLLRSSTLTITNPNKLVSRSQELKALDLHLNPADLKHFYVATDAGCVVHGVRFGNRAYPQYYSSIVDSPVPIVSIDFSPFGQPYFLAAYQEGTLHLFHTQIDKPIATWRDFKSGETLLTVRWSHSRPSVFFVLDSSSAVFTFDLVENGLAPVKMDRISLSKIKCLEVGGDPNLITSGLSRPAHIVCAADTGEIQVFTLSKEMRHQQDLEEEFMSCYVDRF